MVPQQEEEKKSGKMPKIVATFFSACSQGQRMHYARTNIHPLIETTRSISMVSKPFGFEVFLAK
jgi:hypothetical protein